MIFRDYPVYFKRGRAERAGLLPAPAFSEAPKKSGVSSQIRQSTDWLFILHNTDMEFLFTESYTHFPQGYPQSKGSFIISILPLLTEGLFTCQTDRRRRCFSAGFHKHTFFKVLSLVFTSGVAIVLYCIFPKCHTIDFLRYDIISRISDFFCCSTISSQRYDP